MSNKKCPLADLAPRLLQNFGAPHSVAFFIALHMGWSCERGKWRCVRRTAMFHHTQPKEIAIIGHSAELAEQHTAQ